MVTDDEIVARISAYLALTVDHRVLDATQAVPFLHDLVELLGDEQGRNSFKPDKLHGNKHYKSLGYGRY